MSTIRVGLAHGFNFGADVVLLAMDGAGLKEFACALRGAQQCGSGSLEHSGFNHEFRIEAGSAEVELDNTRVVWRLDRAKATEVIDDLVVLGESDHPCHQYVDISKPADTLVLSRDEYVEHF